MNRLIIALVFSFIIGGVILEIVRFNTSEVITTTVTGKERIVETSGETITSYYLIFTEDGTFKLEDELFYGNFRSSDWYGNIKITETYEFKVIGWRIGWTSMYQNIVEYKIVSLKD